MHFVYIYIYIYISILVLILHAVGSCYKAACGAVRRVCTGISSCAHCVKLKFTSDTPLNKRLRSMPPSSQSLDICIIYRQGIKWRPDLTLSDVLGWQNNYKNEVIVTATIYRLDRDEWKIRLTDQINMRTGFFISGFWVPINLEHFHMCWHEKGIIQMTSLWLSRGQLTIYRPDISISISGQGKTWR